MCERHRLYKYNRPYMLNLRRIILASSVIHVPTVIKCPILRFSSLKLLYYKFYSNTADFIKVDEKQMRFLVYCSVVLNR